MTALSSRGGRPKPSQYGVLCSCAAQMFYVDHIISKTTEEPWLDIENKPYEFTPSSFLQAKH